MPENPLTRLLRSYRELEEDCCRLPVSPRDARGRFRRRRGPRVSPSLLKKIDLDFALRSLCDRFFGPDKT
jgi:hypothetical protein